LEQPGELGHPLPGHRIAVVDTDGRSELRVAGPNIAPCYLIGERRVDLPMDEHGFYRTGDAAVLRNRSDQVPVFAFDGRLAEDFKLSSGIKVRTGPLRAGLLAHCAPLVDDIVIGGENCDRLVALVFPSGAGKSEENLLGVLAARFGSWNAANAGSSTAIARFELAVVPADRSRGELSDKGQIVQSRYLRNHAELFAVLQAGGGQAPLGA
jgi:feruloyl-CoA synthase